MLGTNEGENVTIEIVYSDLSSENYTCPFLSTNNIDKFPIYAINSTVYVFSIPDNSYSTIDIVSFDTISQNWTFLTSFENFIGLYFSYSHCLK